MKFRKIVAIVAAVLMLCSILPISAMAADSYVKISSAADFTTGSYVAVVDSGFAMGIYDNGWITAVQPTINGDAVTDTMGAVWTLTVSGNSVTIQDSNGTYIAPKSGNSNGIQSSEYSWAWECNNGAFTFKGTGSDTTTLCSNKSSENKFRSYKNSTASGYPHAFTLYKLAGGGSACEHVNTTVTTKAATCEEAGSSVETCDDCGATISTTEIPATGHDYVDGVCADCGAEQPAAPASGNIEFVLGEDGSSEHKDGSSATTYSETVSGYTLSITPSDKFYTGGWDAQGNSCIKLGTSSAVGGFTITDIPSDVISVIIYAAKYKANTSKLSVNGETITLSKSSNDGQYDEIIVDTTATKEIAVTTVSGGVRAMINTIVFVVETGACDHSGLQCGETCSQCGETMAHNIPFECSPACIKCGAANTNVVDHSYADAYAASCAYGCGTTREIILTIPEANELGLTFAHNTTSNDMYYVVGTITRIAHTTYGNLYIEDEEGNELYIYGVYSADGSTRFDAMDPQPKVGDTIKVYGVIGSFNDAAQMKNGWVVELTEGDFVCTEHTYTNDYDATCNVCLQERQVNLPAADSKLTLVEANALGVVQNSGSYTTDKYYVTGEIVETYKDTWATYGNFYIEDEEGNRFLLYGMFDGDVRYDAMENQPNIGDTVTMYGVIGNYNGTAQMQNGQLIVESTDCEHKNTTSTTVEADCTTAGSITIVCDDCGEIVSTEEIPALGHNYDDEDNVCIECGEEKPNGYAPITSAEQLVSGEYVLVVDSGYAPTYYEEGWVLCGQPAIKDGVIADATGYLWNLTVDGATVKIQDANGAYIAPKSGNTNGIKEGEYFWNWTFANGKFIFAGVDSDTVYLASNTTANNGDNKFRGYKTTTVESTPATYLHQFTLYAATTSAPACQHEYEYECSKVCKLCGEETRPEAEHSYNYACDEVCKVCGQLTNEGAQHTIVHVDAKAGTDCQTYDGNIEHWYCSDCNMVWADEALTIQTNRMSLVATGDHAYDDAYDADCNVCGDTREVPEKPPVAMIYGDANGDGKVNSTDEILLAQFNAGWDVELDMTAADANGDGKVNSTDEILLAQLNAGWDVTLGPNERFNDSTLEW